MQSRWVAPVGGVALALVLALASMPWGSDPAWAQIFDAWSLDSGLEFGPALPSARLQALGGMRVAVPDENNEIHLLDFAGNLAGHLDDKPTGHVDAFVGRRQWFDRTRPSLRDQDVKVSPAGVRVNMIPSSKYALGGSVDYLIGSSERLVTPDFRRRFGLPVENPISGSTDGTLLESDLNSPAITAHYARRLGSKLAAGMEVGLSKENEDRQSITSYEIDHDAKTGLIRASVAVRVLEARGPFRHWVAGANGRLSRTDVKGISADQLHDDVFDWERPAVGYQLHLLGNAWESVKGGVDFRYDSFEGQETVKMNWSAQFPLNPTLRTIRIERSSFSEGFRSSAFRTRWEGRLSGRPMVWGAAFEARQQEFWQFTAQNVNSFVTSKSERLTDWRGTAGSTYFLPRGRGLFAAELAYGWADRDNRISRPVVRVGASSLELGGGAEIAVALPLVLRAGYRLLLDDANRDRDDPEREFSTHRLAAGAGYRSSSGQVLVDLGFGYDFVDPGAGGAADPVEGQDRKAFNLQVRSMF